MRLHRVALPVVLAIVLCFSFNAMAGTTAKVIFEESFESGESPLPDGWSVLDQPTIERSTQAERTGSYSFYMNDTSKSSSVGLRSPKIPIEPGKFYIAQAWAQVKSGTAQLYLEYWDANGTRVDVTVGSSTATEWSLIELAKAAPANAKTVTVLLYGHKANIGTAFYDDVQILVDEDAGGAKLVSLPTSQALQPKSTAYPNRPKATGRTFSAQVQGHPRLRFTNAELGLLQEKITDNKSGFGVNYKYAAELMKQNGDTHFWATNITVGYYGGLSVSYSIPVQQPAPRPNPPGFTAGAYPFWTGLGGAIKTRLETLSLAYAFSGQQRYADKAKAELLSLSQWSTWHEPSYDCGGKTCLDTGYIVEGVSLAYDVLYPQLSDGERTQIRTALIEKGLKPLYSDTNQKIDHNIHMVRTAALGVGALTLLGEEPGMEMYVRRAYENFIWYLDQRLDSHQTEGMLYSSVSMDHISHFAVSLERVTGDNSMLEHPWVKEILPRWIIYFLSPDATALTNFSDSSLAAYFAATMGAIGRVNKNPQANWYIQTTGTGGADLRLLELDPEGKAESPENWPTSAVFADIGWTAMRSGWSKNDTLFGFLSNGSKMGHNHFDQNTFVLNVNGKWLVKDAGYQDYNAGPKNEATNLTRGHNAVMVNGRGQTVKGGGNTAAAFISPAFDYVVGDASAAYAGTSLAGWARHILYAKPEYFVMLDELALRQTTDKPELLLHPGAAVSVDGKEVRVGYSAPASRFAIGSGSTALDVQMIWPASVQMDIKDIKGAEEYGSYISLQPQVNSERTYALTLLTPLGYEEQAPTVNHVDATANRVSFTVNTQGRTDYLWVGLNAQEKPAVVNSTAAGTLNTDAQHALASVAPDGTMLQYALVNGRTLYFGERKLIDSSANLTVSLAKDGNGKWRADFAADTAANVQLWVPEQGSNVGRLVNLQISAGQSSTTVDI